MYFCCCCQSNGTHCIYVMCEEKNRSFLDATKRWVLGSYIFMYFCSCQANGTNCIYVMWEEKNRIFLDATKRQHTGHISQNSNIMVEVGGGEGGVIHLHVFLLLSNKWDKLYIYVMCEEKNRVFLEAIKRHNSGHISQNSNNMAGVCVGGWGVIPLYVFLLLSSKWDKLYICYVGRKE